MAYGFNEDKSKVEVYSKDETYSKDEVYSKSESYSKAETDNKIVDITKTDFTSGASAVTNLASGWSVSQYTGMARAGRIARVQLLIERTNLQNIDLPAGATWQLCRVPNKYIPFDDESESTSYFIKNSMSRGNAIVICDTQGNIKLVNASDSILQVAAVTFTATYITKE